MFPSLNLSRQGREDKKFSDRLCIRDDSSEAAVYRGQLFFQYQTPQTGRVDGLVRGGEAVLMNQVGEYLQVFL